MALSLEDAARQLRTIRAMPYGVARTAAAETITRTIEADGPQERLAEALLDLVEAYTFTADGSKSFVVFARLLRLWDAHPELFDDSDQRNLFWEFKWVAGDLPDYAEIAPAQARAFLADMRERFALAGKGTSSVAMSEFRWSWHAGEAGMEQARQRWISSPYDEDDNCEACRIGQQVDYFTENRRFAEAVALGETLDGSCNLEPTRTRHALALAQYRVGETAAAVRSYLGALATMDGRDSDFAPARGQVFELLGRGGQLPRALRALREDYPVLLERASSPLFRMRFLIGVLAGLNATLDTPDLPTGLRTVPAATVGELHAWVRGELRPLVAAFDARAQTSYYADLVDRALGTTRGEPLDFAAPAQEPDEVAPRRLADSPGVIPEPPRPEQLTARGDHTGASGAYREAALMAEAEGRLDDAGLAWAEAAHSAEEAGDPDEAHGCYDRALPLLVAAQAPSGLVTQVLLAWAPVAAAASDTAAVVGHLESLIARVSDVDSEGLTEELAAQRETQARSQHSDLLDALSRTLASTAPADRTPGRDLLAAIKAASAAGEGYARLGRIADAADAFRIAGTLQRETGDTEGALWSLESAFEGFTAAGRRAKRIEVAGEFIELLRASGQDARAEAVVASLT